MSYISTSIGAERKSRVSGYKIKKGFFTNETANLPQAILILGLPNTVNIASVPPGKKEITSAEEAGKIYGFGSPIHQIMRILRPTDSDGVGGIPTVVIPQLETGLTPTKVNFTVTGTPTKSTTHSIRIAGRQNLDFQSYDFQISLTDTAATIAQRIVDTVNNCMSCPVKAVIGEAGALTFETKWGGVTSKEIQIKFENNSDNSGITYSLTTKVEGTGTVNISNALNSFEDDWFTCVINPYKTDVFETLEEFNGNPSLEQPTGRYRPTVFKPFIAFSGETSLDKADYLLSTDSEARVSQVTNVICPAPGSSAFSWEAAANVVRLFARTMQDNPESDVNGMLYPDMPTPADGKIGEMSEYDVRDMLLKKGCSTVVLNKGQYEIQDLVTTYHPVGENPLQFNYCRNLNLDWNIADAYRILEKNKLRDKVLIRDNQVTASNKAVKPKEWKAILFDLFDNLAERALINEPSFSKDSLQVEIPTDNPNRVNTFFRYKRTGIARIESTTAEAGF